jgi:long-chain acyl-CoA synthetase
VKVVVPATNVAELLRRRAARDPAKTALVDGDQRLTWAELDSLVDGAVRGLSALDIVAGHRVAIALANSVQFVVSYLAVLRGGAIAVPVRVGAGSDEVARVLLDSGARLGFADELSVEAVRVAKVTLRSQRSGQRADRHPDDQLPRLVVTAAAPMPGEVSFADLTAPGSQAMSPRDVESLAVLVYTAGRSEPSRAAMLSHRALLANIDSAARTDPPPVQSEDVVLAALPMSHLYGLNGVLGQALLHGATLVLCRRLDADEALQLIREEHVTCAPIVPRVLDSWLGRSDLATSLASVRTVLCGAAPLPPAWIETFQARTGLRVQQGYGLTEAGPIVTSTLGTTTVKPGSAGRALPGVELRVVDAAGHDAAADDPGEIWVRGRSLFSGYWPDGREAPAVEDWLATGDVGFLDDDGDLFLVDRLDELVVVAGFAVYPAEIEDVIDELPAVRECAVVGVPDERTGHAVVAYIVSASNVDADALARAARAHCEVRLARFKVPVRVEVVSSLPHSVTGGKVVKGRLPGGQLRRTVGRS